MGDYMSIRITDTVEASFKAVIKDVGGFVDAMYRPALCYFIFLTVWNILAIPAVQTFMLDLGGDVWFWSAIGISSLGFMLFSLAVSYSWQRLIFGTYAGEELKPDAPADQFGLPLFRRFLKVGAGIELLGFAAFGLLSYLAFPAAIDQIISRLVFGLAMVSEAPAASAAQSPIVTVAALVGMLVLFVLFARVRLVLSAIAAGEDATTIKGAFSLSAGNSLRLVGAILMAFVGIAIVVIGAMIAMVILMIPVGFVAGLIVKIAGAAIASVVFAPFTAALDTLTTSVSLCVFAGLYAFIYAQLKGNADPFGTLLDKVEEDPFDKIEKDGEVVSTRAVQPEAQKQEAEAPSAAAKASQAVPTSKPAASVDASTKGDAPLQYGRRRR